MARVTVTTATNPATKLDTAWASGSNRILLVRNRGTASVFVERVSTVTSADGFELGAGEGLRIGPVDSAGLYAVAASGSQRVDVIQVG